MKWRPSQMAVEVILQAYQAGIKNGYRFKHRVDGYGAIWYTLKGYPNYDSRNTISDVCIYIQCVNDHMRVIFAEDEDDIMQRT
jgi:hypothetical protein